VKLPPAAERELNVLFLSHSFPRTATDPAGSFVLRLAVALRSEGVHATVVAPGGPGLAAHDVFEGIPATRFRYAPRRLETLAYTGTMLDQATHSMRARAVLASMVAANLAAAYAAVRRTPPALLHAHWWFPGGLAGAQLARLRHLPLVTTLHGSDLRAAQATPMATRLFRRVMRQSTVVTTVSRWLAAETARLVPDVHPIVGPMPVAPDLFHPGATRAPDRLLFIGKLNEQKGIVTLLEALARMHAKPYLDVVVGIGSDSAPARTLADSLGIGDRIAWHPLLAQSALAELYRSNTVFVAPMTGEGLGLVAIEAALSGMPTVAFASGGLTDIVVPERTGVLVPPGDVDALAAALDRVLAQPDQGAALGAAARAHALATFAPDAVARRYADVYRGVLATAPSALQIGSRS
jgi:glycosyltransferase involved in cell wall biosynthesis